MKNSWLIRPVANGINRLIEFRSENIVALGWSGIGDLSGKTREDLKTLLSAPPYSLSRLELGRAYPTLDIFLNGIQEGDIVLVPNGDNIYFAKITSGYYFDSISDRIPQGYSHRRNVKWLAYTSRKALSKELRLSLKAQQTATNLSQHIQEMESLALGEPSPNQYNQKNSSLDVTYPLRPDFLIEFKLPLNISKKEAKRLSHYFKTLYFNE